MPVAVDLGDPLPDLTEGELARFVAGRALFDRSFTAEEGLGPLFNDERCSSCHDVPTVGGTGAELVTKATRFQPPDQCNLLTDEGGDTVQKRATQLLRALGIAQERTPSNANSVADVAAPALFGLGLVESIPLEVIRARADPDDADGDGISGRLGVTSDGRVGLFGRKSDFASLADFVEGALRVEMGITTPAHPNEESVNGQLLPDGADPVPDPEIGAGAIALIVDYVRFLAPPAPEVLPSAASQDTVQRGERLFAETGCTSCHVPTMQTGPSDHPAFDRKVVRAYSDFLLHDLGPGLRGNCGVGATPTEHRTARLVGVRHRVGWMHDDRAATLSQAVTMHGGEAGEARNRFLRLDPSDQQVLIRFVASR